MSRKGNYWDNAAMEAFFNRVRRHSAIGYMTPNDFEQKPNP